LWWYDSSCWSQGARSSYPRTSETGWVFSRGSAVDFAIEGERIVLLPLREWPRLAGRFGTSGMAARLLRTGRASHGPPLLTGDPEIIERPDLPCDVVDLRM